MKIVINTCFGGFGLSPAGEQAYAKKKGIGPLAYYQQTKYKHSEGIDEYKRIDNPNNSLFLFSLTRDIGPVVNKIPDEDALWFSDRDIPRNDPALVAVVEKLGEAANGQYAELSVVEIPDGVEWEIDEYDGNETIDEIHRSWR